MPTPSGTNLRIGAGNVFVGEWTLNDADELEFNGRHAGNCESVTISNEVTKIEKKSSMEGARGVLASAITGIVGTLNLVMNEFDKENVAAAFLSTLKAFNQEQIDASARDLNNGEAIELDHWYDLGGFNADVDSVSQGGALDPDTDYEVNVPAGLIRIKSSGSGAAVPTTWTGRIPELSGEQASGLDTPTIIKAIRVVDAVDMVTGIKGVLDIWRAKLTPNGENELISEEFGKLTMTATILKDTTRASGDDYFRWVPLSTLVDSSS